MVGSQLYAPAALPGVQEAGGAPAPVWKGAENLTLTGIWTPDLPVHSESLHPECLYTSYSGLRKCYNMERVC